MNSVSNSPMTDLDWIDRGKADAWAEKVKQPPKHDPQVSCIYDLGYCEGEIEKPLIQPKDKE